MRCAVALTRKNLLKNPFASSRSSLTCTYKCGNACRDDAPNEFSTNEYFADVAKRAYSRRQALKAGGAATVAFGGASLLAACTSDDGNGGATGSGGGNGDNGNGGGESPEGMRFPVVEPNEKDEVVIPEGYEQNVLIAWGDAVEDGAPEWDFDRQTAEAQMKQFGFNNDFAGVLEAADGTLVYVC